MKKHFGSIMLLVLVFGSIFFVLLGAMIQFVLVENRAQDALIGKAQSFTVAEAGLNYYKWFLAHFPTDFQNGTGTNGPYVVTYTDPETGNAGTYTLTLEGASACGSTQTVNITSQGVSSTYPNFFSTLVAKYGSPTVAAYKEIIGTNPPAGVTFSNIDPDFSALKAAAQANGIFLPQHEVPQSPHLGYRLVFNADATVTVTLVVAVQSMGSVKPADLSKNTIIDYTLIQTEQPYQTFPLPIDCGLIYVEDNVWIEGVIPRKVTLVAATMGGAGAAPDIILTNNLTYTATDGSVGFTAIGEHNVSIAPTSPNNMTLHGIFVAATGVFGRNNYYFPSGGCNGLYEARDTLTLRGTIVSRFAPVVTWVNGCGAGSNAGYRNFVHTLDPDIATNPPPYTPTTSSTKTFIDWQQIN